MKIIHASDHMEIIGYEGESNRTQVLFDLSRLIAEFPGGHGILYIQRPRENSAFQVASAEMNGDSLVWTVGVNELEKSGTLLAKVSYIMNEKVAKTKTYKFRVLDSLN